MHGTRRDPLIAARLPRAVRPLPAVATLVERA